MFIVRQDGKPVDHETVGCMMRVRWGMKRPRTVNLVGEEDADGAGGDSVVLPAVPPVQQHISAHIRQRLLDVAAAAMQQLQGDSPAPLPAALATAQAAAANAAVSPPQPTAGQHPAGGDGSGDGQGIHLTLREACAAAKAGLRASSQVSSPAMPPETHAQHGHAAQTGHAVRPNTPSSGGQHPGTPPPKAATLPLRGGSASASEAGSAAHSMRGDAVMPGGGLQLGGADAAGQQQQRTTAQLLRRVDGSVGPLPADLAMRGTVRIVHTVCTLTYPHAGCGMGFGLFD